MVKTEEYQKHIHTPPPSITNSPSIKMSKTKLLTNNFLNVKTDSAKLARSEPDIIQCASSSTSTCNKNQNPTKSRSFAVTSEHSTDDVSQDDVWGRQRRLSHGDDPYWLPELQALEQRDYLLGRSRKIRVTEVAPTNSSIREDATLLGWKIPVNLFSSKKQSNRSQYTSKRLRSYYKAQDELITAYEDIAFDVEVEISNNPEVNYRKAALYSKISLFMNVLLAIAKAVASVLSGSIAIVSSLVDSTLDLLSGAIMWWATRAMKHRDPYTYPQGRTKLEPVAVIILSVVMSFASLQLIREAVETLFMIPGADTTELPIVDQITFVITGSTIIVKLALWLVCRKIRSSSVQALAQDHRNDVVSNTAAIVCGYLGSQNFRRKSGIQEFAYVDPIGAIIISVYIVVIWWRTGKTQMKMLTGHTARPDFLSKLTWVSINHHSKIRQIDTVRAFHFGNNFLVEVDIVLPADMKLEEAHDIGETLQHRLESLEEVERAFVHLDYEFTHNPHSEHKIV